jgi:protein O-GlcNAc transferase
MTTNPALMDIGPCIEQGDNGIALRIPDGVLPAFLIEAFNEAGAGATNRARTKLCTTNLQIVERMAREAYPGLPIVYLVLGIVYQRLGELVSASTWYERLLALQEHSVVYAELATLYAQRLYYGRALQAQERAMALAPEVTHWHEAYAHYLVMVGQVNAAVRLLRERVDRPEVSAGTYSCYLFNAQYLTHMTPAQHQEARVAWGRRHAPPMRPIYTNNGRDLNSTRRLRVGYLSADFRQHSVAYNFEAALDGRNANAVDVFGYGNVQHPDCVTERLAGKFDHYRSVWGQSDETVAQGIARDRIDILVTLAGHGANHRLGVLAHQPAPIQVDFGALATTGLSQVDYRLTDVWVDPPESQAWYREKLVYLPGGSLCYRPLENTAEVQALPALANGFVTFGSFNHLAKISDETMRLWAGVLRAVPEACFLLKFPGSHDPLLSDGMCRRFENEGIDPQRLRIIGYSQTNEEHLYQYHIMDIALDTFPFNGCVTTLEALWMGVPVISLVGERVVSRSGLNLLSQVGLEYFAVCSAEDYVAKAAALAQQLDSLTRIRASLRGRMVNGGLCDCRRFAGELEAAYLRMWHAYLGTRERMPIVTQPSTVTSLPGATPHAARSD